MVKVPGSRDEARWMGKVLSIEGEDGDEEGGSL